MTEKERARRTAYRSGRKEMIGFDTLDMKPHADRKTDRRVSDSVRRRRKVAGSVGVERTPLKHKNWKRG